jgi:hypothetical protein
MTTELTEGKRPAEFLVSEAPNTQSRDTVTVTVPANTTLNAGTVLGVITATGKHAQYNDGNSNGTQTAAAILFAPLTNDTNAPVDMDGVVINRNAEVRDTDLEFVDSVDEDGALVDLRAVGIKARTTIGTTE